MENCVISRVHFVSNVVLESRSSKCQSLRGLVDCGQQRNVECYKLKSISDRRHTLSKEWTSTTVYSSRLKLRKERRIITRALGADDAEVPLSRAPGWSLSDNLRCEVSVSSSVSCWHDCGHFCVDFHGGLTLILLFCYFSFQQRVQSR